MKTTTEAQTAPGMPERAAHGAEARPMLAGAEASVWTERMLSALVNGVKGGKWFSLMDKVFGSIDGSVRRRLRSLLLKQRMKRSHVGQGLGLSRLWPNAYFAEHGLFALHAAWVAARQSR